MASSLLVLLDDIATVLDDVALMSKTAAKKTAGVLGDDLALNAQQVTGVRADRELSVVWQVAKGSLLNKCILVPLALLISVIAPWLINPLLVLGGLFLCYEGAEKVIHLFMHKKHQPVDDAENTTQDSIDIDTYEKDKVKGAIRTDFILSAEIVVITLGTVSSAPLMNKIVVMSLIAFIMTVGVYGFVALIVKIDDAGLFLVKQAKKWQQSLGQFLLSFAPQLMKTLSVVGTIAMFLVGGGIINHAVPFVHHFTEHTVDQAQVIPTVGQILGSVAPTSLNMLIGFAAGIIVLLVVSLSQKLFKK
ncbi:DUF808 domain-containing protein [Acinetobacter sp. MD2(2019)]|uniref:DUF808 domain-containing protein n=1 Tax=Acinetobacter sp. MD2(2019) TaxID=2605273 RepID=UPI002D1F4713|nr:DUF808 domain-containing protein [Acinetobacter sp. MD2(2019)]MEB3753706.1 DUF808 domain-containing protein [Acinetobacter sp. MD2(2019)]